MLLLWLAIVGVVLAALFAFLPWAGRLATLYLLHGQRDRLYSVGDEPGVRDTLLYKDMEYVLSATLHRVRAADDDGVAELLFALSPGNRGPRRPDIYAESVSLLGSRVDQLLAVISPMVPILVCYFVFRKPAALALVLALVPIVVAVALVEATREGLGGPFSRLARAVDAARVPSALAC